MHEFVTVSSDGERVYAYSGGHLTALDMDTGRVLWTNGLPGYGYGLGTICFPGDASAMNEVVRVAAAAAAEQLGQAAAAGSASAA